MGVIVVRRARTPPSPASMISPTPDRYRNEKIHSETRTPLGKKRENEENTETEIPGFSLLGSSLGSFNEVGVTSLLWTLLLFNM